MNRKSFLQCSNMLIGIAFLVCGKVAHADWVSAEGRYFFESGLTKEECNHQALLAAKRDALSKVNLEKMSAFEAEFCTETEEQSNCELHSQTFSYLDGGYISEVKILDMDRMNPGKENEECVVKLEANVSRYSESPDPNFFLTAKITGQVKKFAGDKFFITGKTSTEAFIYVFFWSPSDERDVYTTLIPNQFDQEIVSNHSFQVPSKANEKRYGLFAEFPEDSKRDEIIEYFFVLATKKRFKTLGNETVESFRTRLDELGRSNWRLKPLGYSILKKD
jgi:hypothetical protein